MTDAATFDVNASDALEPPQLSPDEIAAERQRGRKAGYFALGSAVLMVASLGILVATLNGQDVGDTAKKLLAIDQRPVGWIALNMLAAISTAMLAPLLVHMAIAERRRRPTVPNIVQILALVGPIMVAVALPLQQVFQLRIAKDFAEGDVQTVKAATAALKDTGFQIAASIGLAGTVALGFALVMISYYAIGTGLFTRFIGVVGIIIGFMNVLPILGAAGILQVFWLSAVAMMLLGPAERQPPAWAAGRTVPWPKFGQDQGGEPDDRGGSSTTEPELDDGPAELAAADAAADEPTEKPET